MSKRSLLALELILVFVAPPTLIFYGVLPRRPLPYLLVGFLCALVYLRKDSGFDGRTLIRWRGADGRRAVLEACALALGVLGLGVLLEPEKVLLFPQTRPGLFMLVVCLYPLLSAYPQEVIFRPFFFRRYRPLFPTDDAMIMASAFVFAFVHIIFFSPLSFLLSFIGGAVFARRYHRTGQLLPVAIQHAILGIAIFAFGLGHHFYHGARP